MKFEKIYNKGQAQLFKNEYLEYLTKTHPLVIWGLYLPIISWMLFHSYSVVGLSFLQIVATFFGGMFFWSFFEYCIHRFAFHLATHSEKEKKIIYLIHGNHHEYPRDRERLFMPPVPSLILATLVFIFQYLIGYLFGATQNVFTFFSGFLFGYLIYGSIHYAIHAWNPPFKWMKPLWRNHHLHHYKSENMGFGVSTTFWDRVLGAMFNLNKEKDDKEKVRALMFEEKPLKKK
jgi:sterol desaturase/sphingolipid hydroxylase (fatty acid hydroxylase superfamily)